MFIQIQIQGRVSSIHWQKKSSLVLAKGGVWYVGIAIMFGLLGALRYSSNAFSCSRRSPRMVSRKSESFNRSFKGFLEQASLKVPS